MLYILNYFMQKMVNLVISEGRIYLLHFIYMCQKPLSSTKYKVYITPTLLLSGFGHVTGFEQQLNQESLWNLISDRKASESFINPVNPLDKRPLDRATVKGNLDKIVNLVKSIYYYFLL